MYKYIFLSKINTLNCTSNQKTSQRHFVNFTQNGARQLRLMFFNQCSEARLFNDRPHGNLCHLKFRILLLK